MAIYVVGNLSVNLGGHRDRTTNFEAAFPRFDRVNAYFSNFSSRRYSAGWSA
jgi:hypothetical protein